MKIGAPLPPHHGDPEQWVASAIEHHYTAVYSPLEFSPGLKPETVTAFRHAAEKAGLVISEVGAWSNPMDADPAKAADAVEKCIHSLALAEEIGARCCVNIVGSRNPDKWDGPHPDNFSDETFDRIVDITRTIIDAVNPKRSCYALETMPWIFPSTPDQYLDLIQAIDRPGMGVHLDPVNMINCPERVYNTGAFISDCFAKLGPHIRSCHAKDIVLRGNLTLHLDECCPGEGVLDYGAFLTGLSRLDPDTPLMAEHLPFERYPEAVSHIRRVASEHNLSFT